LIEKVEVTILENQKLKKYLTDATTRGKVVIESNDVNNELAVDNERLRDDVKKLKIEKEHLATSVQKFNKGQYFQNELLMNTIMKNNKSGIGYNSFVQKKETRQNKLLSQSSALSVEKKDILPTITKPNHQLPCCHTWVSRHQDPGANIITRCARTKSHKYDESWHRIECHNFTI
jgi:hypothetical protein